jgi:para-nitrobenzyl esterase
MKKAGCAYVLAIAAVVSLPAAAGRAQVTVAIPGDPVKTDAGLVAGTLGPDGVKTYFGVPFAAPPVRENRWRAPQPVTPWAGVLTASMAARRPCPSTAVTRWRERASSTSRSTTGWA